MCRIRIPSSQCKGLRIDITMIDFVNTTSLSCSLKKTEQTCTFQRPPYSKEDQVGACQILFNLKRSKQSKSELLVKSLYHPTSDVSLLQGIMYRLRGPSLMFNAFVPRAIQTAPPLPPNKLFHILSPNPFQPLGSTGKKYVT